MEIGSIYEIDPGMPGRAQAAAEKISVGSPGGGFPGALEAEEVSRFGQGMRSLREVDKYEKKYQEYTGSGREAIALALRSIVKNRPGIRRICLLPAYMCDTVFPPFERQGWKICFYPIEKDLEAGKDQLCRLIGEIRPGVLFIHAYYGMDTWREFRRGLFAEWRALGICIMEDVTQSYYLEDAGREADYVVGSLRKWYAIPDGGFAASDEPLEQIEQGENPPGEKGAEVQGYFTHRRLELMWEKWEYLNGKGLPSERAQQKEDYLKKNREMEEWLDHFEGITTLSRPSWQILGKTDEEACKRQRKENCRYLSGELEGMTSLRPVFASCGQRGSDSPDGGKEGEPAPLYFPVYADNRESLQEFLCIHDIYAPVLWPVGKENAGILREEEIYIYEHMLALPVDQRYGRQEMERMAQTLWKYEKENGREVIGIRADANETVAAGHIMRCITIARELVRRKKKVVFFTADTHGEELLKEAGMESVCLHTCWNDMEGETEKLRRELRRYGCKKLLVDSYQVSRGYFEALREGCRLIYIDDCFEDIYPVDMLINYNAFYTRFPYEEAYGKGGDRVRLLLGTDYVPLREEFERKESAKADLHSGEQPEEGNLQVLLACGGGDEHNALSGILRTFAEDDRELFTGIVFHVVVGSYNRNGRELRELAERFPNIILHFHVTRMAELMGRCDAAVSAAGTMLFELCAVKVPAVFFVTADNQRYDGEFFAAQERMLCGGDIRQDREQALETICRELAVLLQDKEMRGRMKEKLGEVTDGRGAGRIAEAIAELEPISLP